MGRPERATPAPPAGQRTGLGTQVIAASAAPAPGSLPPAAASGAMPTMSLPITVLSGADSVTIGVAVEIPEPWATQLQQARERVGDPLALAIPAHVTLLPPTSVPREHLDVIIEHLEAVAAGLGGFELRLEGTDTFRPVSPVVFVRVAEGGRDCDRIQRDVRTGPLRRDLSFPFHPHVTVAHHVDEPSLDTAMATLEGFSATFAVEAFWLYEHGSDGVWRPRQRFAFGRRAGGDPTGGDEPEPGTPAGRPG
jgi:2'-5' RNA ligase